MKAITKIPTLTKCTSTCEMYPISMDGKTPRRRNPDTIQSSTTVIDLTDDDDGLIFPDKISIAP